MKKANKITLELESTDIFKNNDTIICECDIADENFFKIVENTIYKILNLKNQIHLANQIAFVIKELISNANKANLKRIYFKLKKININNKLEYDIGVKCFTHHIINKGYQYIEKHAKEEKVFIKVLFKKNTSKKLSIYVINNANITIQEKNRIKEKVKLFKKLKKKSPKDFNIIDETEGAGMGIFLSLRILKKIGINSSSFKIYNKNNTTIASLSLKYNKLTPLNYKSIAKEILQTIQKFYNIIDYKTYTQNFINKKIFNIDENKEKITKLLIKILDKEKVYNLINNTKILLDFSYINYLLSFFIDKLEINIKNNIYKVALLTVFLGNKINNDNNFLLRCLIAGLICDFGIIILSSIDYESQKEIEKRCFEKGIDIPDINELITSSFHAKIGSEIAKLFNFPELFIKIISFHHEPDITNNKIILILYLAEYFSNLLKTNNEININLIFKRVLKLFNLKNNEELKKLYLEIQNLEI